MLMIKQLIIFMYFLLIIHESCFVKMNHSSRFVQNPVFYSIPQSSKECTYKIDVEFLGIDECQHNESNVFAANILCMIQC